LFFKDPIFKARAAIPAPLQSDRLLTRYSGEGVVKEKNEDKKDNDEEREEGRIKL
jgi:hypothetical protein